MSNTFIQTPKRPNLPPTPMTNCKPSLPPLSALFSGGEISTPYRPGSFPRLPSIDTFTTPSSSSRPYSYLTYPQVQVHSQVQISEPTPHTQTQQTLQPPVVAATPSKASSTQAYNNFSFANTSVEEVEPTAAESATPQSKSASPIESKAYAFISHSPATFPNQEPSIDNAPLARRKRRRTSPNELSILNREFELGSTPNKPRRIEIAKRVSMTEKAVQIWFQNKRQSLRKHSNIEKEVTEIPETLSSTNLDELHELNSTSSSSIHSNMVASTPIKPGSNKPLGEATSLIKPGLTQSFSSPNFKTERSDSPQPILVKSRSFSSAKVKVEDSSYPFQHRSNSLTRLQTASPSITSKKRSSSVSDDAESDTSSINNDDQLVLNMTNKKQPTFLNSTSSSTMTFKLAPAKPKSPKKDLEKQFSIKREPLREISLNSAKRVKAKLDNINKTGENECIENLLSLRAGNWK